jgi:succinoglycan biosynthesis protein ExoA
MSRLISIIVPCRNEAGHIAGFLTRLFAQQLPADTTVEVLIADGLSQDATTRVIDAFRAENPGITQSVQWFPNPAGFVSAGLNEAIRRAQGDIILRMDVHTDYAPDYVKECLAVLEETGAQNVGGPTQTAAHGYWQNISKIVYHARIGTGGARFHNVNYEGPVDTVSYGCWRRQTLVDLGGFDENLVRNQDDELNLRLTRSGGRIWQSRRINSWFHPRSSLTKLFRQYLEYGYWKPYVIRKHRLPSSVRQLIPPAFALVFTLGAAAALAVPALRIAWLTLAAVYLAALIASALWECARPAMWKYIPALPLGFAAIHFGYGWGFWMGIADLLLGRRSIIAAKPAVLSR